MIDAVQALIRRVFRAGPDGWGYDALLVAGPLVVLLVAILGRSPVTTSLSMIYVALFVGAVLYNGLR